MPRKYLMTPDFKVRHARWKKLYKGVVYRVSCSDLNIPEGAWNAQDSYQASNEWWLAKRAELDSAGTPAAPQPAPYCQTLPPRDSSDTAGPPRHPPAR